MAIAPASLQRIVFVTLPAAVYFAVQALGEWGRGARWHGAAFAVMAMLTAAFPFVTGGRGLIRRRALGFLVLAVPGIWAWLAGPTNTIQAAGFIVAVLAQVTAMAMARRHGVALPPVRDDAVVQLGVDRHAG
jgi:hypothetical protein